jgi:hypothetical protein
MVMVPLSCLLPQMGPGLRMQALPLEIGSEVKLQLSSRLA